MATPTTDRGLRRYDHLEPCEAVRQAWQEAGRNPLYHFWTKRKVKEFMPVLARALDRIPNG